MLQFAIHEKQQQRPAVELKQQATDDDDDYATDSPAPIILGHLSMLLTMVRL